MDRVNRDLAGRYPLDLERLKDALEGTNDETPAAESNKRRKTDQTSADFVNHLSLFNTKLYSDVVLIADGQRSLAHRELLSERCDYFRGMFEHQLKEKTQQEVEVKEVEAGVFKALLHGLYKGEAEAMEGVDPLELIEALKKFHANIDPSGLYNAVSNSLDPGNVLGALKRAKFHGTQPVIEACRRYIWTHHSKITQLEGARFDEGDREELVAELMRAGQYKLPGLCLE